MSIRHGVADQPLEARIEMMRLRLSSIDPGGLPFEIYGDLSLETFQRAYHARGRAEKEEEVMMRRRLSSLEESNVALTCFIYMAVFGK